MTACGGPVETPAVSSSPLDDPSNLERLRSKQVSHHPIRWALFVALIAAEIALIIPNLSFSAAAFTGISWGWLLAAIGAEVVSLIAFARMRRSLLRAAGFPIPRRQIRVLTLASNAISITAPAGTAVSNVYLYRQLRRVGANTGAVTWTLLAGSVVSALAFSAITIAGTLLSGSTTLGEIVGASALSLIGGALLVGGLAAITSHPGPLVRVVGVTMARLPRRWTHRDAGATPRAGARRVLEQLAAIHPRLRDWSSALALSILNWTADLACFVLCLYAVGADGVALSVAVLAYAAGLATIGLSVTPGGLGSIEAGMLIVLTHGGVANPLALAGIVIFRLVAYVLFGVAGWIAWLDVRRRQPSRIHGCAGCDDPADAPARRRVPGS